MDASILQNIPAPESIDLSLVAVQESLANDEVGVLKRLLEQFPPQTPQEAAKLLIDLIDKATRETSGGEFINVDGTKLPW